MNILIYVPQMAPFGGMERHVCGVAAVLARRGHAVTLLTTSHSLGDDLRNELARARVKLRELHRERRQASRLIKMAWTLKEVLTARRTTWDLIYTNGQSGLARFAWFAAGRRTRIVHHHHTTADLAEQATWSPSFRRVLTRAPELVGCSRATCGALARAVGREDVRFLPYLTASPLSSDEVEDRNYGPGTPLNFGFTGRLVKEKGIDALCALSARQDLGDITWHLHGSGPAYPREHFARFPRMVYHGPYSGRAEQARALQALDALVLFSIHNEGMPLSLIEGMSAGLPWIATDRGGTSEVLLSPPNSLLVPPGGDLDALAAAVSEMATRLRTGQTSRRAQRLAYDTVFSPETVSAGWCRYLEGTPVDSTPGVSVEPAHEAR